MTTDGLALAAFGLATVLVIVHRRAVARVLWRDEDPRTMAALRIAVGACTFAWALDLAPLVRYLFTDEGLFLGDTARQTLAPEAFAGWAGGPMPGDGGGWFDAAAVVHWLAGSHFSPLLLWDAPAVAWTSWGALLVAAVALTIGWHTTIAKWSCYALVVVLVERNTVFLAGEQVLLNALLAVCCSRCDRAWSLDRRGRVLVRIPAWPRVLALLGMVPLYFANGVAKTGARWTEGSTLHYLLHNPDFARFDAAWIPSWVSLWLLRPATWSAHLFELLFPLVVIGTLLRWGGGVVSPLRLGARLGWAALGVVWLAMTMVAFDPGHPLGLSRIVTTIAGIAIVIAALVGPRLWRGLPAMRRTTWARWLLGRRVWLSLHVVFTGSLIVTTDLGWFVPLTLAMGVLFFEGDELAAAIARLRRRPFVKRELGAAEPPRLPRWAIAWLLGWHLAAVAMAQLPRDEEMALWRERFEQPLRRWIVFAHTWQTFRMFAPDGPAVALDLQAERADEDGHVEAIDDGLPSRAPRVLGWGRDKSHKVAHRLIGNSHTAWFRKWHARWLCRTHALQSGVLPTEIRLLRVSRHMPTPEGEAAGPLERTVTWQGRCADEVEGQPPPLHRARHGVTLSEPFIPWNKERETKWLERAGAGEVPSWPWVPLLVLAPLAIAALRRR